MPYAPKSLVESAADALIGQHPLAVLVLPTLLRRAKQAEQNALDGVSYGSTEELEVLEQYFRVLGSPTPERPFRAIWSDNPLWQDVRYPGRTLQRQRKDRAGAGKVLKQTKRLPGAGERDTWALLPTAGADLFHDNDDRSVRVVDLALWYGRNQDVAGIDALMAWFLDAFPLRFEDLIGTIYSEDVPPEYRAVPFADEPMSQTDYSDHIAEGGVPEAIQITADLPELIEAIEARLDEEHFQYPPGLVRRVLTAWLCGDIVVLVGQPGTGKSAFSRLLSDALAHKIGLPAPTTVPVHQDFDESEFIGYERLDGTGQLRQFAENVLRTDTPLDPRIVILEEFNLATVESYLAPILVALASQDIPRMVPVPGYGMSELPIDTFIIATCNSYLDEPETRTRLSYPAKRRSSIITMPNILFEKVDAGGANVILDLALEMISAERRLLERRREAGRMSGFDRIRSTQLASVAGAESLSQAVRDGLTVIVSTILASSEGRSFFTMGLLRDVALAIAYADRAEADEMEALRAAIADKVVHQLRGPHERADEVSAALQLGPDAEISALLARMKGGSPDDLLPLV